MVTVDHGSDANANQTLEERFQKGKGLKQQVQYGQDEL